VRRFLSRPGVVVLAAFLPALALAAPVPPARPDGGALPAPTDSMTEAPAASGAAPAPPAPEGPSALLRVLDKFSGVAQPLVAPLGAVTRHDRLTILVEACDGSVEGDVAWLTIVDAKTPEAPVFEGWMFAESPALSALDHPRYDVWLAQCNTESAGAL
jgi:hypothetical protein